MAHKFAHDWTSWELLTTGLSKEGDMDLKKMNANGHLDKDEGKHKRGGQDFKLGGESPDEQSLTLESETGDTFEGKLIFERRNRMIIFGIKHVGHPLDKKREGEIQDDPPWLLTKP